MLEGVGFPARCGGGAREFQTEYGIIVLLDQKRKLAPRPPPTILRDPKHCPDNPAAPKAEMDSALDGKKIGNGQRAWRKKNQRWTARMKEKNRKWTARMVPKKRRWTARLAEKKSEMDSAHEGKKTWKWTGRMTPQNQRWTGRMTHQKLEMYSSHGGKSMEMDSAHDTKWTARMKKKNQRWTARMTQNGQRAWKTPLQTI